ncbi:type II toxin-antitoxin system VapB family antitoxin [Nocardia macrotermitis]|uniref:Antitoxin VapB2 n=1 Tax=Nocardia macrotermitis TaxID=2585198 RepID=A0A7K0D0Y8_9NOCA|nr:ribbon-helix-helix protein, CopG family [Nocardia macrotermitis]MQY19395.1 Antitoxin VapB2 [Nocardia macrotermitis]
MSTDLLVRDVPDNVVAAIDAKAKRLGVSRTEYVRRTLARELPDERRVTMADLRWFSETFADLADEEVMRRAWE